LLIRETKLSRAPKKTAFDRVKTRVRVLGRIISSGKPIIKSPFKRRASIKKKIQDFKDKSAKDQPTNGEKKSKKKRSERVRLSISYGSGKGAKKGKSEEESGDGGAKDGASGEDLEEERLGKRKWNKIQNLVKSDKVYKSNLYRMKKPSLIRKMTSIKAQLGNKQRNRHESVILEKSATIKLRTINKLE
jgi:hypothetical protein